MIMFILNVVWLDKSYSCPFLYFDFAFVLTFCEKLFYIYPPRVIYVLLTLWC